MDFRLIISLIFAIIVAIFAILNSGTVDINIIFTKLQISQALVILISTTLGAIVAMFLGLFRTINLKKQIKNKDKEIREMELKILDLNSELDFIRSTEQDITEEEIFKQEDELL